VHWAMPSLWDGAAMEDIFPYISTFPIACPPVASPNDRSRTILNSAEYICMHVLSDAGGGIKLGT